MRIINIFLLRILCILLLIIYTGILTDTYAKRIEALYSTIEDNSAHVIKASGNYYYKKIRFETNVGQTDTLVKFLARSKDYVLYFTQHKAIVSVKKTDSSDLFKECHTINMQIAGANPQVQITGRNMMLGKINYYRGNNPDAWQANIANYASIEYKNIYPYTDLIYYGNEGQLEFDFVVMPGGNPERIQLNFSSDEKMKIDKQGNLIFSGGNNPLFLKKPVAYQEKKGNRIPVSAEYIFRSSNQVGFSLGDYNPELPLVIDPLLVYFSYLGSSDSERGQAIAIDKEGCAYVTGYTHGTDFPIRNAYQSDNKSDRTLFYRDDVFVTKFNADGTDIIYSTYIGGRGDESGDAIAVDPDGQVYITGLTNSSNDAGTAGYDGYPVLNAFQEAIGDAGSSDAFVTVLDKDGQLAYSTYLGGSSEDYGTGIDIDKEGKIYITGRESSADFPVKNAFMETKPGNDRDAFVTKIDPTKKGAASLIYSTHLGGVGEDKGNDIAVDTFGCAYITGITFSSDFPVTEKSFQTTYLDKGDFFVTKLSVDGSGLVYSTFLGDNLRNEALNIEVDDPGCTFVSSISSLYKINEEGSGLVYTFNPQGVTTGLAIDQYGNAYTAANYLGGGKGGIVAINPEGTDTLFTYPIVQYLTDVAINDDNLLCVSGYVDSDGWATDNAYQTSPFGDYDAFVAKFEVELEQKLIVKVLSDSICGGVSVPVASTLLDIYSIDLSNKNKPLTYIESMSTDKNGLLHLSNYKYKTGSSIFLRITPEIKPAIKQNRTEHTSFLYKVHVDNLNIDKDGTVTAQYLEADHADTTLTYLSHTSLGFCLIISIEWLASEEYITYLKYALVIMNNFLYDVTNGQAFIDTIAIFDNKSHWNEADIQIKADNTQWPCAFPDGVKVKHYFAHVSLPPVWSGSSARTIQLIYISDPLDPYFADNIITIVHELGHYLFNFYDEYIDQNGKVIFEDINFGFMDYQYDIAGPRGTEMSNFYDETDLIARNYKETDQYANHGLNCWDYFQSRFGGQTYGNVVACVHTPKDIGIPQSEVMKGPNYDMSNPDFSVGSMMGFEDKTTRSNIPRLRTLITVWSSGRGRPVPGARVWLNKKDLSESLYHGKSNRRGGIKLFNAEPGDTIFANCESEYMWHFKKVLIPTDMKSTADEDLNIELKTLSAEFSLLSGLAFTSSGKPVYQCLADPLFSSSPYIQIFGDESVTGQQILSESSGIYSTEINITDFSQGQVFFSAPDSDDEDFFVIQDAFVMDNSEQYGILSNGVQLEYKIDTTATTAEKIAFLASAFPAPSTGLPDSVLRVSDVISINTWPGDAQIKMQVRLHYFSDSLEAEIPEAVTLYKWEDGWVPVETEVDLSHNEITATIDNPGYFVAYLDLTKSQVATHNKEKVNLKTTPGIHVYPNYPNPFDRQTTIKYSVTKPARVILKIYSPIGQELETLVNEYQPNGTYEVTWEPKGKPHGLYLFRLIVYDISSSPVTGYSETGKMMFLK